MPGTKATNKERKREEAAIQSFHEYYAGVWGEQRWHDSLFPALCKPTRHCALVNTFSDVEAVSSLLTQDTTASRISSEFAKNMLAQLGYDPAELHVVEGSGDRPFPQAQPIPSLLHQGQLLSHWALDFASVLAACVLQVVPGEQALDLCAAPGGKSLVLSHLLWGKSPTHPNGTEEASTSCLHSNEYDKARFKRLMSNLQSFLPPYLFASGTIKTLNVDASAKSSVNEFPLQAGQYDKILLDAPCSSERHIIHAYAKAVQSHQISDGMLNWKSSHSKTLAKTQLSLLMTAIRLVKVGGRIVYATCSISNEENDSVIDRALDAVKRERKKNAHQSWKVRVCKDLEDSVETAKMLDTVSEKTSHGRIILPDHPSGQGWGPLYFCVLQKISLNTDIGEDTTTR